jgi:hypothetical protein
MNQTSIQSFYSREVAGPASSSSPSSSHAVPDGFTNLEVQRHLHPPALGAWQPSREYPFCPIADLRTGHERVQIRGRVVNLHHQSASPGRQPKKKGCWKLVIVDDTGAVNVMTKARCYARF